MSAEADDRWAALLDGASFDGDPGEVGGPRGWSPLHYVCHSRTASVEAARDLLERGADPNACFANEHGPMSALYGAAGVRHSEPLTRLLLEYGADPNGEPHFGDALYHSVESPDPGCCRALLEGGARPDGSSALAHALDYERAEHVRLLLEHGAHPDGEDLVHAVRRGRDAATIQVLLDAGADPDGVGGEWSTPKAEYRSAYANAFLRNRADLMAPLEGAGASTAVTAEDGLVAAVARGESAELPDALGADQEEALAEAALNGFAEPVVAAVGVGRVLRNGGGPPGSLLHMAAWVGDEPLVRRLLELGADPVAEAPAPFSTPLAWNVHGSQHGEFRGGRVAVADLLLAAGAELEPRFLDTARGPLRDWLSSRSGRDSDR